MRLLSLLRTSTFNLALIYMVLFAGSVLVLLSLMYWSSVGYISRQTDATIDAEITGLAEQYRRQGLDGLVNIIAERMANDPSSESLYLFASSDYTRLAGNLDAWPTGTPGSDGWLNFDGRDLTGRLIEARAKLFRLRGGLHLLVGREVRVLHEIQRLMLRALGWGLGITLALALVGGSMMSWSMVRRIEAINQTSRDIMTGDLSRRIPTRGTGDDFDELADNLNGMLEQIEQLMTGVREVADNIAHDLRTPLTRVRNRLEQLHLERHLTAETRDEIEQSIVEADQLLVTFSALLRIARIESGTHPMEFQIVELDGLVRDAVDLYEALAEEKGLRLICSTDRDVRVQGDRDLLFQAIVNLLDNAIKYTSSGGRVDISARRIDSEVSIAVTDTGPGVPEAFRGKVLQRFYRLEGSRSTPGNGLGLSLVSAVVGLHHATLQLSDNNPGLRVTLTLPASEHFKANTSGKNNKRAAV